MATKIENSEPSLPYFRFMVVIYRLGIWFYWLAINILKPFNQKAKKFADGRKGWRSELARVFAEKNENIIWFHAASLGEFEQGRPVMESLKKKKPDIKILLTFFSPSGFEIRKNYAHADWVVYLPIDTPSNARYFIETARPQMAIFIKYEFWYFYLRELQIRKIPTLVISSIFRENQLFFHWTSGFYRKVLREIEHYFVQDDLSGKLIRGIGAKNVSTSGDTRFDRVIDIANDAKEIGLAEKFKNNEKLMVLGSTWMSDIDVIAPFVQEFQQKLKFIIAPHNIDESEIEKLDGLFPEAVRYSQALEGTVSEFRILIVDNMGMLSSLYRYGDFAFIGGAFRGALHNTLEAAVYGIPVCYGEHPNNQKFKEAIGLAETAGGFTFSSVEELKGWFESLWKGDEKYRSAADQSRAFVQERAGATPLVVNRILEFL